MLFQICLIIGAICWLSAAAIMAAMFGAMFAPDKPKLISRCVISSILFIPALVLVPLSFTAGVLIITIAAILGLTLCGVRMALELIMEGIPEIDDEGNLIEVPRKTNTAPWV
tara:strand:+ start:544 stop:879 length:336 start_codon:yes stop_codon:yes gene_type:complete